jgi:hypothetical protein
MLAGEKETRKRTECRRDVGMCALPGVEIVDSAIEEYSEKRKERVRTGRNDSVELEQWVKIEHCRIG